MTESKTRSRPLIFFGREKEMEHMLLQLTTDPFSPAYISILGPAGVGKTTLALSILHQEQIVSLFEQRYFVPCDSATSHDGLLATLGRYLHCPAGTVKRIVDHLKQPKKCLIVLNNFETPWEGSTHRQDVELLLTEISSIPTVSIIVTMRGAERPYGTAWTRPFLPVLVPFSRSEALQTFSTISDLSTEVHIINQLLDCVGDLPLAVVLLANLAQTESPSSLLRRWAEEETSLLTRGLATRLSSLDASIELSITSERIASFNPEAVQLLAILSLLPDGLDSRYFVTVTQGFQSPARCLSALLRTSLAYCDGLTRRIQVLPPIRAFMLRYHDYDPDEALSQPLLDHYVDLVRRLAEFKPFGDNFITESECRREIGNLEAVLQFGLTKGENCCRKVLRVLRTGFRARLSYLDVRLPHLIEAGLRAARKLNEPGHVAHCLLTLSAELNFHSTRAHEAKTVAEEALSLFQEVGDAGEAGALLTLSFYMPWPACSAGLMKAAAIYSKMGKVGNEARCLVQDANNWMVAPLRTPSVHLKKH